MSTPGKNKLYSERLKHFRESVALSQKEFAEKLGIAQRTYSNYENGRLPPADVLRGLAHHGLNIHWLLTGEGEMQKASSTDESQLWEEIEQLKREVEALQEELKQMETPDESRVELVRRAAEILESVTRDLDEKRVALEHETIATQGRLQTLRTLVLEAQSR